MDEDRRSAVARAGVAALNILTPGLGLLRLNSPRQAFLCWLIGIASLPALLLFWAATPILPFALLIASYALMVLGFFGSLIISVVMSWRQSRFRAAGQHPIWTRWYSIVAICLVSALISNLSLDGIHAIYKPFYLPSENMAPTLLKDDRIIASMREPDALARGDVILFAVGKNTYIKRIAGLPGDTIGLRDGVVILNGQPVAQTATRNEVVRNSLGQFNERRLREQFPGEEQAHEIYDSGPTEVDEFPETQVKPGHLFVLGDNRDFSADSRVSRARQGVEQLPIADVRGKALYYSSGPSHRSGERITP